MIDVAQVQGQVHGSRSSRVGELAERPETRPATIIRQWLSRDGDLTWPSANHQCSDITSVIATLASRSERASESPAAEGPKRAPRS